MNRHLWRLAVVVGVVMTPIGLLGCGERQSPPAGGGSASSTDTIAEDSDEDAEGAADNEKQAGDDASATPGADESSPTTTAAPTTTFPSPTEPSPEPSSDSDASTEPSPSITRVMLGSPELTAGIPGEGPLTADRIGAWLDDPSNHAILDIELPLGLNAGAGQVKGLDTNPLTRAKIELGRQLYFDPRLSKNQKVACASCHAPEQGYAKETQFGVGIEAQLGNRNSPVAYNRILSDLQFWDGRAATLEEQAKGPIANPIEMGNTHEACVTCLEGIPGYVMQFKKIFEKEGELTIDNVAKAIASFERVLVTGPSPFDYGEQLRTFADVDAESLKEDDPEAFALYEQAVADAAAHPMSESAKRGRDLFFGQKANCTACHVGPNLSDEKYHNLGVGMDAAAPDLGRYVVTMNEADKGAFKTPTIRNVELTAPYMHDGSQKTLEEVVEWYNKGGHPNPHLDKDIRKLELTDEEQRDLVAFMKACTGPLPDVESGRLPE